MKEIVLRRALDPTDRVERLVQRNPSLGMETLHAAALSGGRVVTLQRWQGSRAALASLRQEVAGEVAEIASGREGLTLHVVERAGGRPTPLALLERHLGAEAVARGALDRSGVAWRIVGASSRLPAFMRALREAEDAYEKAQGAGIPRYAQAEAAKGVAAEDLNPKERAVLAQAHKLGFFARPRKAGIEAVGAAVKMPASTALYHLRAAQAKLVESYLRR